MQPVQAALLAALDSSPTAAAELYTAAAPLLTQGTPAERADALAGIGNLADRLGDAATELRARKEAVAAWRQAGDDRDILVSLSFALYNLAMAYSNQGNPAAAVPLLEEVVALDERTGHDDLESDRAALEQMRRRAAGEPEPGLREAVDAWVQGGRDEQQFASLVNAICNMYVQVMQTDSQEQRAALADDLAHVRAARPLPIAGANDFLSILQRLLRGEPELVAQALQQRAALPAALAQALDTMERMISGEADAAPAAPAEPQEEEELAAAQAMLSQLSPEQRAELAVAAQVMPYVQQALGVLRNPEVPVTERARLAEGLEHAAEQAAADEAEGSPWLAAATALRVVAGWLRGTPPDAAALPEPYQSLITTMIQGADE
jgi:tetratricopeptide (TPR) repeat protein